MKPEADIVDHISVVEQLANQLTDLREPVSEQTVMCKIMSMLPSRFRHMQSAWDIVPRHEQTLESLILRLLKEESRNRIEGALDDEEEKAFFSNRG
jgi:hypothetical protein